MGAAAFRFVQVELGSPLGPADGRHLIRRGGEAGAVVVLETVLAAPRRRRRRRRVRRAAEPVSAPTVRATVVDARGFDSENEAVSWLASLRSDPDALSAAVEEGVSELNGLLRAHRVAAGDAYTAEVSARRALAVRVGHGPGDAVAHGQFDEAIEVPRERTARRGQLLAPAERLARIVGGHEPLSAGEELLLRARADLRAGRPREAALQARVALEALLAEPSTPEATEQGVLVDARSAVTEAAQAALDQGLTPEATSRLAGEIERMSAAVRRRALAASG